MSIGFKASVNKNAIVLFRISWETRRMNMAWESARERKV